jgi:acetyl-CoA acyltransferase
MAAHIVGAGMTPFGFAPDATLRSLAVTAVDDALADAGIGTSDVDMVVFANAGEGVLTGQEMVRGEVVFHRYGFGGAPMLNVENACASASTALHVATLAVAAGAAEIAVAVGAEKLTNPDKRRTMAVFSSAVDFDDMPDLRAQVERDLLGLGRPAGDAGDATDRPVQSALMAVYAATARRFFARGGASVEDAAAVAVKNRAHAAANPRAQFRQPTTVEQVLASRMIADPLRLHMCSPVADGAAAVVVCSEDRLGSLTRAGTAVEAVRIDASVLRSGGDAVVEDADIEEADLEGGAVSRAAAAAYEATGVGPDDLDVVEVHDAAAPAELLTYEQLGLCAPGGAPRLLAEGSVCLGGRRPVNPSGGLLSRGHPIGATGLGQVVELVDQLRGRCGPRQVPGARVALAQNSGGYMSGEEAVAVVTILSRGRT